MATRTRTETDVEFWSRIDHERLASEDRGVDFARERRDADETLALCDQLEREDKERAADELDALTWKNELTGLPLWEPVRFRTRREEEYMEWVESDDPAAERTRRNLHARLEARMQRGEW